MPDTGDGTHVKRPKGLLLRFAPRTADCDAAMGWAAGGVVIQEPKDVMLEGDPPMPARYSFCEGPDGEQIELPRSDRL